MTTNIPKTISEIDDILKKCIAGRRHADYQRTLDVKRWTTSMMTGDDQEEIIVQYRTKETQQQEERRIRVYNSRTQHASQKVVKFFNEVHRADTAVDVIQYEGDDEGEKKSQLLALLDKFYSHKSHREYLDRRYPYFNFHDPNAFLIIEFFDDEGKLQPYPYEVESQHVLDFGDINGVLEYVVVRSERWYELQEFAPAPAAPALPADPHGEFNKKAVSGETREGYVLAHTFTVYHKDVAIRYTQEPVSDAGAVIFTPSVDSERVLLTIAKNKKAVFFREEFPLTLSMCPARRFGYYEDVTTDNRTVVSPLNPAEKIYNRLCWRSSEYDLSHALHGFYQKFQYVKKCETCFGEGRVVYGEDQNPVACHSCKGTGKEIHTTVQDVVYVTLPSNTEDIIDLARMVHMATIPMELITLQSQEVESAKREVFDAIFSDAILNGDQLAAKTATEWALNWRSVHNTLHPYSESYSQMLIFIVKTAAEINDMMTGLSVNHSISKDYKLESIAELIQNRKSGIDANLPKELIVNFDYKILARQNRDDPAIVERFKIYEKYRPFGDKTEAQVMSIVGLLGATAPMRVRWLYYREIMDEVFEEHPDFGKMKGKDQRAIIDAKTLEYIERYAAQEEPPGNNDDEDESKPGDPGAIPPGNGNRRPRNPLLRVA